MDPLVRQAQRTLSGQEDVATYGNSPGWLFTVDPNGPQAGSVKFHYNGYTHYISEALADGGVLVQDRRMYDVLRGLGVYSISTPPAYKYPRAVLLDQPLSYWRLGESGTQRIARDLAGTQKPNLLDNPNFEADSARWAAWGGGTSYISVGTSTAQRNTGSQSLLVTGTTPSTGYAEISAYSQGPYLPVIPGHTYTFSAYVYQTAGGTGSAQIYIRWLDAGNAQISQWSSAAVGALNSWRRLSVTQKAPAGAVTAQLILIAASSTNNATATAYFDSLMFTDTPSTPAVYYSGYGGNDGDYIGSFLANLLSNPSLESGTTGWTQNASTGTITTFAQQAGWAQFGLNSLRLIGVTAATSGAFIQAFSPTATVAPGTVYTGSLYVNNNVANANAQVRCDINWYNSGVYVGTTAGAWNVISSTGVRRLTVSGACPVGANQARVCITASTLNAAAQSVDVYVDAAQLTAGPDVVPYSDTTGVVLSQAGALANDIDGAVQFDGQSGSISIPPIVFPNDFSIEFWSYATNPTPQANDNHQVYGGPGGSSGSTRFLVRSTSFYWGYTPAGAAGETVVQSVTTPSNINTWVHWVAVKAGTGATLYRNGAAIATMTGIPAGNCAINQIGGPLFFLGRLDEVAVYNIALSQASAQAHYSASL